MTELWNTIKECLKEHKVFKKETLRIHNLIKDLVSICEGVHRGRADIWEIVDHQCGKCGGRILRCKNTGMSPGGNPLWCCADCGNSGHGLTSNSVCRCGADSPLRHQLSSVKRSPIMALRDDGEGNLIADTEKVVGTIDYSIGVCYTPICRATHVDVD